MGDRGAIFIASSIKGAMLTPGVQYNILKLEVLALGVLRIVQMSGDWNQRRNDSKMTRNSKSPQNPLIVFCIHALFPCLDILALLSPLHTHVIIIIIIQSSSLSIPSPRAMIDHDS